MFAKDGCVLLRKYQGHFSDWYQWGLKAQERCAMVVQNLAMGVIPETCENPCRRFARENALPVFLRLWARGPCLEGRVLTDAYWQWPIL